MKRPLIFVLFLCVCLGMVAWEQYTFVNNRAIPQKIGKIPTTSNSIGSQDWIKSHVKIINAQATNLDTKVLELSLTAYANARKEGIIDKDRLTIIDYTKASTERRMWVVDMKTNKVLFNTYVSHGKNSGKLLPTSFSNQPGSLKSSFGVFRTDQDPYMGNNGYSLRLIGLERGINDNAYSRNVVIHGATYVSSEIVKQYKSLGRSWGCPAVATRLVKPLINAIKQNSMVFVYYPDKKWLTQSRWLKKSNFLLG